MITQRQINTANSVNTAFVSDSSINYFAFFDINAVSRITIATSEIIVVKKLSGNRSRQHSRFLGLKTHTIGWDWAFLAHPHLPHFRTDRLSVTSRTVIESSQRVYLRQSFLISNVKCQNSVEVVLKGLRGRFLSKWLVLRAGQWKGRVK